MADRVAKRSAGVTRIIAQPDGAGGLSSLDLSELSRFDLERIALARGLSITGTDAALRARILADVTGS